MTKDKSGKRRIVTKISPMDIYLDGFATGAASAILTYGRGATEAEADAFADDLLAGLEGDPAVMAELEREILERFVEIDRGPRTITSYAEREADR